MWRDDLWTVDGWEFFLETYFEWSKTPFTLLRTMFDPVFWVVCADLLLQSVKPEIFSCFTALVRGRIDAELTLT